MLPPPPAAEPIHRKKFTNRVPPAGIVTACEAVAISAAPMPPNHAQMSPVRGVAVPPPLPQPATSHSAVPKFDDVEAHGPDPSRLASKLVSCSSCAGTQAAAAGSKPSQKISSAPPEHGTKAGSVTVSVTGIAISACV